METNFNFKSSACTDKNHSERLLALGLKPETADMALVPLMEWDDCTAREYFTGIYVARTKEDVERYNWDYIPAWSLGRLIELMPRTIVMHFPTGEAPDTPIEREVYALDILISDDSIAEAVSTVEWLIKEGYFNKEYLEE